jgi:DNA-binding transcriptional LysR family regulator
MQRLEDLVLFAEVVDRGGFAAAARALGMQRSKLSRRVAELEQRMGVRLLQRSTRQMALTPAGEQIYGHAHALAESARLAFNVAMEIKGTPGGVLKITAPAPLSTSVLVPIVAEFNRAYPSVTVELDTSERMRDLITDKFALAFRAQTAPLYDSSLVARQLAEVPMMVVGSPALLGARPLQHPEQLADLRWLASGNADEYKELDFFQQQRQYVLRYLPQFTSGDLRVLLAAAVAGIGAVCLPRYLCSEPLSRGELVCALDAASGWQASAAHIHAVLPSRRGVTYTTRLFLEFVAPRLEAAMQA